MKTKIYYFFAISIVLVLLVNACTSATPTTNTPPVSSTATFTPSPELTSKPTATLPATPTLIPESASIKAIEWSNPHERWDSASAKEVINQYIIPAGANYVVLTPICTSQDTNDVKINCEYQPGNEGKLPRATTDEELVNAIKYLHSAGLRVILKPQFFVTSLVLNNFVGHLGENWNDAKWEEWFGNYTAFVTHYAQIAEDNRVDLLIIGNELADTTQREQDWRSVIAAVRSVYHGPITYASNAWDFEASKIKFWDALNYIGTNGYLFGQVNKKNPSIEEMVQAWKPYTQRLEEMSKQYGKQVIITEIGATSKQGVNSGKVPDWIPAPYDGKAQADFYTALFETVKDKSWIKGVILFTLDTNSMQGGINDIGYSFVSKPAEQVVHYYFGGAPITPAPAPNFIEDPANSQWIYQDGLSNGWRQWEDPDAKILPDLYAHNGHDSLVSIQAPISRYREIQLIFDTPYVKMSKFKWIEFYIMVGRREPTTLLVSFGYWTPEVYTLSRKASVNDANYIENGKYIPGTWQRVRIPLIDLGITSQVFNELHISACDWPCALDSNVDDIYIDDIRLIAGK
ncbi:MAG: hypothetical protein HYX49_13255 [Chloroflexi bacterium]|nr:hypothetical protein [Chloroflexota bacterium]